MRSFLLLLCTLAFGNPVSAQTQSETPDIEAFFSLVQTGGATSVKNALSKNPALATATDSLGFQPIHMLDYTDFDKILGLLIGNGADINAQNDEGIGLIHILIDEQFLPAVLSAGADLELKDKSGRTPVMVWLTEPDGLLMVAALLQAGADPNAKDSRGQSVMDYARLWNDPEVEKLIVEFGGTDLN